MTEISNEYATALFMLALEENKAREYYDFLESIAGIFENQPEYAEFLASPAIAVSERISAIDSAFSENYPEYIVSYLKLLCEKGRIRVFGDCLENYRKLLLEHERTSVAKVISAVPLTEQEKAALALKLSKKTGHSVKIENVVDDSVIAGLIIEVDGRIIDGSVRGALADVKDVISK